MDIQLQELVEKIRKDGVETAEAESAEIVKKAGERAEAILNAARAEADALVRSAKEESEKFERAAVSSVTQAARNLMISFRDGIEAELERIVRRDTKAAYDADTLKALVPETVKAWIAKSGVNDIAVLLSEKDAAKLESALTGTLRDEISKGLVIRVDRNLDAGFRIATKDGSAYYDFSAGSVADLFSAYLNPRVAEILKSAAKGL
jgi:V/A-type H+-transporting ATPase subunit E